MYDFLGWLTFYALFRIRNDRSEAEIAEQTRGAEIGVVTYTIMAWLCNLAGWVVFIWLVWLIFW
jgi:hypothetical protein